MPDSYVKQNCCLIRMLGNKNDTFLEISFIANVNSRRKYIQTSMGYPMQFAMSEKLNKGEIGHYTSILHDEINLII